VRRIYPGNSFHVMHAVADIIQEITAPDDEVFVFGAEPEVLFYARRRSASRYIYQFPLYGPFSDAVQRQQEVIRELGGSKPKVVFVMPNAMFFAEGTDQSFTRWLRRFVQDGYQRQASVWIDQSGSRRVVRSGTRPPGPPLTKELGVILLRRPTF
jgi:hypothetical protein